MGRTKIEWAERTYNVVSGCSKVSEACLNCYAETMTRRLAAMPCAKEKYKNGFEVTLHPEELNVPYRWTKPSRVFVCSMSDLFHEKVPIDFISKVMDVIRENQIHTFQILTKRSKRMAEYFSSHSVPMNAWVGVTCESPRHYDRVNDLRTIDAPVRFISCEPLLGDMGDIDLSDIDWVITGGESGVDARRTPVEWFKTLRDACVGSSTPFFFKQWGAWSEDGVKGSKYKNGSLLDGREWKQYPTL